jgi:hypothetical protein
MTKEELVKTLKEYNSKWGTIKIPCNDEYGGKELKEVIFKTLGLDVEKINDILFDYDYAYSDMQCSSDPDEDGPETLIECKKKIKNIFKKINEVKGLNFGITDQVDDDLEQMLEAAEDYSYTLREGLKNDYKNEEDWKEDLEYFLKEASWLK